MQTFDLGIIGAGVAGVFAALRAVEHHNDCKTILFELGRPPQKRRRQLEGWMGCFPTGDGKLYPLDVEQILDLADGRRVKPIQKWVMSCLQEAGPLKLVKDSGPNTSLSKKITSAGFEVRLNDYYQWKPESVHQLSRIITKRTEEKDNLQFSFDNEVERITKKKGVFIVSTALGDYQCKKLLICAGRSGWKWANRLFQEFGILSDDNYANFGIRAEISGAHMKEFNKSHCSLLREGLEIGPFSWNGTVIPVDHDDVAISAFRSNEERWKSEKVSFSIIHSQFFKNAGCNQTDRLGKLAFLLFNDRVGKEKIKLFLKKKSQLSLVPEYNALVDILNEIESFIPNLSLRGYFHVPNILPLPGKIRLDSNLESEVEGLFVAGETARIRGILGAAISGVVAVDGACR